MRRRMQPSDMLPRGSKYTKNAFQAGDRIGRKRIFGAFRARRPCLVAANVPSPLEEELTALPQIP